MATKITKCPKCDSKDINTLDKQRKETVKSILVTLHAKCRSCDFEFGYSSATAFGRRKGVKY